METLNKALRNAILFGHFQALRLAGRTYEQAAADTAERFLVSESSVTRIVREVFDYVNRENLMLS